MNVVMGLNPSLPATMKAGLITESTSADTYAKELMRYLRETHRRVKDYAEKLCFEKEGTDRGDQGVTKLCVGDLVALKATPQRTGERRFGHRTTGEIYRITQAVGENTYALGKVTTGAPPVENPMYPNRYAADRLIRLDMPEYEVEMPEGTPQKVEIYDEDMAQWDATSTERWAVDGRVSLRFDGNEEECIWVDLTNCRYRWLAGPIAAGDATPAADGGEETLGGAVG